MFCPKCGDHLVRQGNEMACIRGNMQLSRAMHAQLDAAFISNTVTPAERPFPRRLGGNWFCPGDATQMIESEGVIRCPSCRRSLNQFVYRLIELHPHKQLKSAQLQKAASSLADIVRAHPSERLRKQTGNALLIWSILPFGIAVLAVARGEIRTAALFVTALCGAVLAAALARSKSSLGQLLSAVLLLGIAIPFAVKFIRGIIFARGAFAASVADSPAGYIVNMFVCSLFFVPLAAFAYSIWRNRRVEF